MPESPRYAFRMGRREEARQTMARLAGVNEYASIITEEMDEITDHLAAEQQGGRHSILEIFTAPGMLHRTVLGMVLQAGQQLTGANFFFYYGTTIFKATGISNSYITSIILGAVNATATIASLWLIKRCGQRVMLMTGAAVMFGCFMIYSSVGHFALDQAHPKNSAQAGAVLITFTCIFIAAFAITVCIFSEYSMPSSEKFKSI